MVVMNAQTQKIHQNHVRLFCVRQSLLPLCFSQQQIFKYFKEIVLHDFFKYENIHGFLILVTNYLTKTHHFNPNSINIFTVSSDVKSDLAKATY